jgi:serine protease
MLKLIPILLTMIVGTFQLYADSLSDKKSLPKSEIPYINGHILVKISEGAPDCALEMSANTVGAEAVNSYSIVPGLWLYKYDMSLHIDDVLGEFYRNPYVVYAEPDYIYHLADQNDSFFPKQWDMQNIGQNGGIIGADVNALGMWAIESGDPNIVIGVIDTGIDYTHPDLTANIWVNVLEIPQDGIDNDGNGYVDDVYGINAIQNSGNPMDDNSHGTHVSGTIGAVGNNNIGIVGMAQNVQIVACKFLSAYGSGGISDAIECMQYLADLKTRATNPVNIIAITPGVVAGPLKRCSMPLRPIKVWGCCLWQRLVIPLLTLMVRLFTLLDMMLKTLSP